MTPFLFARARRAGALLATAGLVASASPAAADDPQPGYQVASQPLPAIFSPTCTLPGGDLVIFDGSTVDRYSPAGGFVSNLATLPAFTFPSFVEPTPDGTAVVFGESSNHDLFLAQADGTGYVGLVNLPYNYDADWLPGGDLIVSAATNGFGAGLGNDIARVTLAPPSVVLIGHVEGPSGPVVVNEAGDLIYATQDDGAGPPPGETDVILWPAATVALGGLSEANALTIGQGFDGGASLDIDPISGALYMAESNYGMGEYRVLRVGADKASSPVVVDDGVNYINNIEFVPAGGPGSFAPWQPEDGVNLKYNNGFDQFTVRPLRPVLTATGPGTTGPGAVTLSVTGGVPSGEMYAAACPLVDVGPVELPYALPTFLYVTAFDLSQTRRAVGSFLPLDANGDGSITIVNPGTLQGVWAWQFLVADGNGVFLGSTTTTSF